MKTNSLTQIKNTNKNQIYHLCVDQDHMMILSKIVHNY